MEISLCPHSMIYPIIVGLVHLRREWKILYCKECIEVDRFL